MQLSRTVSGCNSGSYSFSVSLTSCITGFAIHRGPAHGVLGDVDVADAQASPRLIYFGSAGPYDPDVQWGRLSIYLNVIPRLQLEGPVQELKRQAAAALPAVARFFHAATFERDAMKDVARFMGSDTSLPTTVVQRSDKTAPKRRKGSVRAVLSAMPVAAWQMMGEQKAPKEVRIFTAHRSVEHITHTVPNRRWGSLT